MSTIRKCADCGEDFEVDSLSPNQTTCDDCISKLIDDEYNDGTPDYYYCPCCGHTCAERPAFGGQCPKCITHMEEGYF
jgi:hypothetical protein